MEVSFVAEMTEEIIQWHRMLMTVCMSPIIFAGLIMVLAGASEFDPQYNKDATSRPADNVQIPQVSYIERCFINN